MKKFRVIIILLLTISAPLLLLRYVNYSHNAAGSHAPLPRIIHSLYGDCEITEPLLLQLMDSAAMQRLKHVNQYGVWTYCKPDYDFNRFDHSVGVMLITRRFGGSIVEQAASLLHDVSHTVFSHVAERVKNRSREYKEEVDAYQDGIQSWYMSKTDIPGILSQYSLRLDDVLDKGNEFKLLDQPVPDLCADRIDYNLRGGYLEKLLTAEDVNYILDALRYEHGVYYFVEERAAQMLAETSVWLTKNIFACALNAALNEWAAQALCRAFEIGLVTDHEFHFSQDDIIWNRLSSSSDPLIKSCIYNIVHGESESRYHVISDFDQADKIVKDKFRHVDPLVEVHGQLNRLSSINDTFAQYMQQVKAEIHAGIALKFTDNSTILC